MTLVGFRHGPSQKAELGRVHLPIQMRERTENKSEAEDAFGEVGPHDAL